MEQLGDRVGYVGDNRVCFCMSECVYGCVHFVVDEEEEATIMVVVVAATLLRTMGRRREGGEREVWSENGFRFEFGKTSKGER